MQYDHSNQEKMVLLTNHFKTIPATVYNDSSINDYVIIDRWYNMVHNNNFICIYNFIQIQLKMRINRYA